MGAAVTEMFVLLSLLCCYLLHKVLVLEKAVVALQENAINLNTLVVTHHKILKAVADACDVQRPVSGRWRKYTTRCAPKGWHSPGVAPGFCSQGCSDHFWRGKQVAKDAEMAYRRKVLDA